MKPSQMRIQKPAKIHTQTQNHAKIRAFFASIAFFCAFFCIAIFGIVFLSGCADKFSLDRFSTEEKTRFFALMEQTSSARYAIAKKADTKTQMALLLQACKNRLGLACWIYAYEENSDKKAWNMSLERAALTLKNACLVMATQKPSIASGQSCAFLGIMLSQYPQMQVHIWELIGRNIQIEWLYQKSCEMGEGWGCYRLSYDFLQKDNLERALKIANDGLKMTAAMCDRGVGYYCALSGVIYQYPLPNFVPSEEVRQEKMRYFWEKGCLKKDGDSCIYLENLNNGEYKTAYYPNKNLPNGALQESGFSPNMPKKSKKIKSFSDDLDYSKIIDSTQKSSTKSPKPKNRQSTATAESSPNENAKNAESKSPKNQTHQNPKNQNSAQSSPKSKAKIESIDIDSALAPMQPSTNDLEDLRNDFESLDSSQRSQEAQPENTLESHNAESSEFL